MHASVECRMMPEISRAIERRAPVVALESTLIAHGLPWPRNLETANLMLEAVRRSGAVPATIAILGGTIHLGLSGSQLEHIARPGRIAKAGRRDLAATIALGRDAATTVSATSWIAHACGIGVLATGGLGGVHRGAATSFDVSTDLDQLARADGMLVVCSGVKNVLDVPATLEVLETHGVAVLGYRTDTFPAFTVRSSGLALEHRVETPAQAAAIVRAHRGLKLPGAIVLAQPVPEDKALDPVEMELALDSALAESVLRRVSGKAITPFLLERLRDQTAGRSLDANIALILANAALAGEAATQL